MEPEVKSYVDQMGGTITRNFSMLLLVKDGREIAYWD